MTRIGIITKPKTRSKVSSASCDTTIDPINDPTTAGPRMRPIPARPATPRRRKVLAALNEFASTPTRFEPLAVLPGTSANTSSGTVSSEPPPAMALMTPATSPPPSSTTTWINSIAGGYPCREDLRA
jgi:hypothetical protein